MRHNFYEVRNDSKDENKSDDDDSSDSSDDDDIEFVYEFCGLACVIGDRFVREWDSYESEDTSITNYNHTSHDSSFCDQAQIIGHKGHVILYPKYKHHSLIYVNLDNTLLQVLCCFVLCLTFCFSFFCVFSFFFSFLFSSCILIHRFFVVARDRNK